MCVCVRVEIAEQNKKDELTPRRKKLSTRSRHRVVGGAVSRVVTFRTDIFGLVDHIQGRMQDCFKGGARSKKIACVSAREIFLPCPFIIKPYQRYCYTYLHIHDISLAISSWQHSRLSWGVPPLENRGAPAPLSPSWIRP